MFGVASLNSTDLEPTDWRITELSGLTQLSSIHPDTDTTGKSTFTIPSTPFR